MKDVMIKLQEGKDYIFKTIRITALEDVSYYVLEGPDGRRYLLDMKRYEGYGIESGKDIVCRVDKINCKGELFLEPQHPLYREGESYPFLTEGYEPRIDKHGNNQRVVRFSDALGNRPVLQLSWFGVNQPAPGDMVNLTVERILKGRILFEGMEEERHSPHEEDLNLYDFTVMDIAPGMDGEEYFIVKGDDSVQYTVRAYYYRHYGLKPGVRFKGRFVRYKEGEEVRVEPENPWYKPGEIYPFRVKEKVSLDSDSQVITLLSDQYGFSHSIEGDAGAEIGGEIMFKVERIRKGWPLLRRV
jgi:hypothetical protein